MAQIRRGTIVQETIDALKLQVGNVLPDQTSDKFVLTYDFSNIRRCNIVRFATATYAASTIYTTPATEDFYLTSISFGLAKDATADPPTGTTRIIGTIDGAIQHLLSIPVLTLTASQDVVTMNFTTPIKIDRNTAIQVAAFTSGSLGLLYRSATITGYTVSG